MAMYLARSLCKASATAAARPFAAGFMGAREAPMAVCRFSSGTHATADHKHSGLLAQFKALHWGDKIILITGMSIGLYVGCVVYKTVVLLNSGGSASNVKDSKET